MKRIALLAMLAAFPAMADEPQKPPEMVLVPRAVAEAAARWIAEPTAGDAVKLYASLVACIADNPHDGIVRRSGADQCPVVTEALSIQAKRIADLTKEHDAPKVQSGTNAAAHEAEHTP